MSAENKLAFPLRIEAGDGSFTYEWGMTLRDYFAGQALVALVARDNSSAGIDAAHAYLIADAMLEERKETK